MNLAKLALVFVCLVDVMGQGLAFPIFNTLMLSDAAGFLPPETSQAARHLRYGLLIGVFFFTWFLGAVYMSRISDSTGRKRGILICLTGSLAGYALTLVAIAQGSFWLLVLSRAITGFTAGNQPIAQAAMVDMSKDAEDQARNMGLIVVGFSLGLIGGPIIGGIFSSPEVLPGLASLALPFYVGGALILVAMAFIALFFKDMAVERVPLRIEPLAVVALLWEVTKRPLVMRIAIVFFFYMMGFMGFYVFFDNILASRVGLGTDGTSAAMFVLGGASAIASLLILPALARRLSKFTVIAVMTLIEIAAIGAFAVNGSLALAFVLVAVMGAAHAIAFPSFLNLYSQAAGASEQGWIMGVSTALFTLASAVVSFLGGVVAEEDAIGPFVAAAVAAAVAIALMATVWRERTIHELAAAR